MFSGRRVATFCVALVVGVTTWGVVGGVSALPQDVAAMSWSVAGTTSTTVAMSDTTTTTINSTTTTRPTTTTTQSTTTTIKPTTTTIKEVDRCPNIAGIQATVPAGMFVNSAGNCVPIVDRCPNIAGIQATVPAGMFVNSAGNCVPIVDRCPNIAGIQATVPAGMFVNSAGNCIVDVCVIGGTGPGGGIVFYVAPSPQPWGRCLEAAPNTWNGGTADPGIKWGCPSLSIPGAQGTAIGTGQANTTAIVLACGTSNIAARRADNLVFGGKSDWFLPSKGEVLEMNIKRTIIGGLTGNYYWSSSETLPPSYASLITFQSFGNGNAGNQLKLSNESVRPIRAIN